MAVEWIGGIPEEELEREKSRCVKNISSAPAPPTKNQKEFATASVQLTQFCQMMWQHKREMSDASPDTEEITPPRSYKNILIFKM